MKTCKDCKYSKLIGEEERHELAGKDTAANSAYDIILHNNPYTCTFENSDNWIVFITGNHNACEHYQEKDEL